MMTPRDPWTESRPLDLGISAMDVNVDFWGATEESSSAISSAALFSRNTTVADRKGAISTRSIDLDALFASELYQTLLPIDL